MDTKEAFSFILNYLQKLNHSPEAMDLYRETIDLKQKYDIVLSEDGDSEEILELIRELNIIKIKIDNIKETVQWKSVSPNTEIAEKRENILN